MVIKLYSTPNLHIMEILEIQFRNKPQLEC